MACAKLYCTWPEGLCRGKGRTLSISKPDCKHLPSTSAAKWARSRRLSPRWAAFSLRRCRMSCSSSSSRESNICCSSSSRLWSSSNSFKICCRRHSTSLWEKREGVIFSRTSGAFTYPPCVWINTDFQCIGNSLTGYSCFSPLKSPSGSNGSIPIVTLTDYSGMKTTGEI